MTDREKLAKLLIDISYDQSLGVYDLLDMRDGAGYIADLLIANGVTVQNWRDAKTDPPKEWRDSNGRLVDFLVQCKGGKVCIGNCLGKIKHWIAFGVPAPVTRWMHLPETLKEE